MRSGKKHTGLASPLPCHVARLPAPSAAGALQRERLRAPSAARAGSAPPVAPVPSTAPRRWHPSKGAHLASSTAPSPPRSPLPALVTPHRAPQGSAEAAAEAPESPSSPKQTSPPRPSKGMCTAPFAAPWAAPAASRGGEGAVGAGIAAPVTCPASPNPKKGKGTRCAGCLRSKYPRRGPAPALPPPPPVTFLAPGPAEEAAGERLRTGGARPRVPVPPVPPAWRLPGQSSGTRRGGRCGGARLASPGGAWGLSEAPPARFHHLPSPPARTTYHFITGAPTNFTARRRLPRRRAPARPRRLPPGSAPARAAEAERGVAARSPRRCWGERRRPRRWSSCGAAAPTTTPGVRREAAVTSPAARRRSERGSRPAALQGAAPALGHRRGARGGRKDGAPRCPPPAAAVHLHPCSPPCDPALPAPALRASLRPSGERRCRERRGGRPLFPRPSAAMREREPGRSPRAPLVPRAAAALPSRPGAAVPGGHGPACPAAPAEQLRWPRRRAEPNPPMWKDPQEGSGGRVWHYQLDEMRCYSVVFWKGKKRGKMSCNPAGSKRCLNKDCKRQ